MSHILVLLIEHSILNLKGSQHNMCNFVKCHCEIDLDIPARDWNMVWKINKIYWLFSPGMYAQQRG